MMKFKLLNKSNQRRRKKTPRKWLDKCFKQRIHQPRILTYKLRLKNQTMKFWVRPWAKKENRFSRNPKANRNKPLHDLAEYQKSPSLLRSRKPLSSTASMNNKIIWEVNPEPYKLERHPKFFVMTGLIIRLKATKGSPTRNQWNSVIKLPQKILKSKMSHLA